jgi:thiosulfate/3-mercaptopyruvate sulfurtransferase
MSEPSNYADPAALVSTDWVAQHLNDPRVKIVEVDVEPAKGYDLGHVPGAIGWNWQTDLCDTTIRDLIDAKAFAQLASNAGISPADTVVFYGDMNNWFAAWAFWQFTYHGHHNVKLMNGGRKKWEAEGRPYVTEKPKITRSDYPVPSSDESVRSYRDEVLKAVGDGRINLIDVRSPDEFTGKILAPEALIGREGAQRGGHIPGARNVPWSKTVNDDGTFKSPAELTKLYTDAGVDLKRPTIAYCRIGERSSHTWFVLKYLLGATDVKNYDGSWTEWGNLVGAPIEKGEGAVLPSAAKCQ